MRRNRTAIQVGATTGNHDYAFLAETRMLAALVGDASTREVRQFPLGVLIAEGTRRLACLVDEELAEICRLAKAQLQTNTSDLEVAVSE